MSGAVEIHPKLECLHLGVRVVKSHALQKQKDGTSRLGCQRALELVVTPKSLLWSSMPCTGGSPWQRINVKKPGGFARLRKHVKLFSRLWHNFEIIARQAHKVGNP